MDVENKNQIDQDQNGNDNNSDRNNNNNDDNKIASLCLIILENRIDDNKDALFTLLGLESDGVVDQEIVADLKLFLDCIRLIKFEDILDYLEDNKEADFIRNIEKDFDYFQKQNPHIKAGTLVSYCKLRDTLLKHTDNSIPTRYPDKLPRSIQILLHKWLRKLPKYFDIPDWEGFQPGFPKQPDLVMPLDITVHKQDNPDVKAPSIILHGLKDISEYKCNFTSVEAVKYIELTAPKGPSSFYGLSGSGKTRSLYEFASRYYSMYFLASDSTMDLGSCDLYNVIKRFEEKLKGDDNHGHGSFVARKHIQSLLYARLCIFNAVCKYYQDHYGRSVSPYEWLLLQLSPQTYGGTDIFDDVAREFRLVCDIDTAEHMLQDCAHSSPTGDPFYVFVDEVQNLFEYSERARLRREYSESSGSLYSVLITNLSEISEKLVFASNKRVLWFPVTAGTGLRHDNLRAALKSIFAKLDFVDDTYIPIFYKMTPFQEEDVRSYLEKFMQLDKFDDMIIDHVCGWLKGRPRFVATFVQSLMMFDVDLNNDNRNRAILNHLDEFIKALGLPKEKVPTEWSSIARAGYLYDRFDYIGCRSYGFHTVTDFVINNMYSFRNCYIDYSSKIVDDGLGYIKKVDHDEKIFEPIIIQAVLQYFADPPESLKRASPYFDDIVLQLSRPLVRGDMEPYGFSYALKWLVAFYLFRQYDNFLDQINVLKDWSGNETVGKLSYGILVKRCENAEDTINWLKQMINAPIPGSVPPICNTDKSCGPTLIFFLHPPGKWEERVPVLVRVQYSPCQDKVENVLHTVDPSLMFHINRGTEEAENLYKNGWGELYEELFHEKPVIRIVLQYPRSLSSTETITKVVKDEYGGLQIIVDGSDKEIWQSFLPEFVESYLRHQEEKYNLKTEQW